MRREAGGQKKAGPKMRVNAAKNAQPKNNADANPKAGRGRLSASPAGAICEAKARFHAALGADIGFAERLTWFWSNHFCVSADKGGVRPICGAFEREAIRAHVLGRFGDMLLAVESHPAMLVYLDNARSIGPNSRAGQNRRRGLNENLAREILELHTLGVRSVYSQDDVTSFAKVITGWSIVPPRQDPERGGAFNFNPRMHEPGPQTVIGKRYGEAGVEQGRQVLADLARHPATASHVARKFARHFIADEPAPALVERLSKRSSTPTATSKSSPRRWSPGMTLGKRRARASSGRANGSPARCARSAPTRPMSGRWYRRKTCSANRCGGCPRRTASPTTTPPGSTACRSGSTWPINLHAGMQAPIRWRCSAIPSRRSRRRKHAAPLRAPKAVRRRWRCC
jgi:hypothetical protein